MCYQYFMCLRCARLWDEYQAGHDKPLGTSRWRGLFVNENQIIKQIMAVMRGFNGPLSPPSQPISSDWNGLLEMLRVNTHLCTLDSSWSSLEGMTKKKVGKKVQSYLPLHQDWRSGGGLHGQNHRSLIRHWQEIKRNQMFLCHLKQPDAGIYNWVTLNKKTKKN